MTISGDLAYAYARLSARFGERPDEAAWRSIEAIRELPSLLETARARTFKHWLEGIATNIDAHGIEAAMRTRGRAIVFEVARWMPSPWQPAVEWAGVIPELPVIEHLARGGEISPWMREDRLYRPLCEEAARRPTAGPLAPLAGGWQRSDGLFPAWCKEWLRRMPRNAFATSALLGEFTRILASHRAAMNGLAFGRVAAARVAETRADLATRLALLFRRATLDPAAAFIFLALSALDLERLRGELLRRALFPAFPITA